MVSDASAGKAPIAKTADKISGVFVPVVISISVITAVIWLLLGYDIGYAVSRGISVLVISCPCALGLATPVAIMVANGVGARNGILFKTAETLEMAGKTAIIALDKTGTITKGDPAVTDILPANDFDERSLLQLACTLEQNSEHPLAKAIMKKAEENNIAPEAVKNFQVLPGSGLAALIDDQEAFGGNKAFIGAKISIPQNLNAAAISLAEQGKTALFFGINGKAAGILGAADTIKEDSRQAINELHEMDMKVIMLTGDDPKTAEAIGQQAGVDKVMAGLHPEDKAAAIKQLKAEGPVAMVGDGINDAPALTLADTGIAIGAGTDVAIDAADIVLMNSHLIDVPAAIRLSRAAVRNIKQNLFWAFFYNSLGIPLAAGAFTFLFTWQLSPMFAAAAMSLSSFCVVSNALRLNLTKIYAPKSYDSQSQIEQNLDGENNIEKGTEIMKKTIKIEGMMCPHCEAHVKKCLEALDPVSEATASHQAGTAIIILNSEIEDEKLRKAVEAQGYTVTGIE